MLNANQDRVDLAVVRTANQVCGKLSWLGLLPSDEQTKAGKEPALEMHFVDPSIPSLMLVPPAGQWWTGKLVADALAKRLREMAAEVEAIGATL